MAAEAEAIRRQLEDEKAQLAKKMEEEARRLNERLSLEAKAKQDAMKQMMDKQVCRRSVWITNEIAL
jgi:hypothetical protein